MPDNLPAAAADAELPCQHSVDWRSDITFLFGWHDAESDRIWCGGTSSALLMAVPPSPHGVAVEFELTPFVDPAGMDPAGPRAQTLDVTANGLSVGSVALSGPGSVIFLIPPDRLRQGGVSRSVMLFQFDHPASRVPASCGAHLVDQRDLAFALLSARIWFLGPDVRRQVRGASSLRLSLDNRDDHAAAMREVERRFETPVAALVQSFESLGVDCEFGLLQRDCGSETLGLLRFSTVLAAPLLRGLETGFAGLADPEHLIVTTDPSGEFIVSHARYLLRYHTFVHDTAETAGGIVARELKRLPFLWRKLSEDLFEGSKLFVRKSFEPFSVHAALPVLMRLQRYCGTNALLVVNETADPRQQGMVEEILPGLLRGFVDRLSVPEPGRDGRSVASWLEVCLNARALLRLRL